MIEVAERNAPKVAEAIGYSNVEFRKGRIQDLGLDLRVLEKYLLEHPVHDANGWMALEGIQEKMRKGQVLVEDSSVDVVVSNCVLNLVDPGLKKQMFREIYRVLKTGGRAVISDIVADEEVPEYMQRDEDLWSGCISGAMTEQGFIQAFEESGFHGIEFVKFESEPWRTVEGIEFRSVTVQAHKGKEGPCYERNQAVIYNGPFKEVLDDDGHSMVRGVRHAVCDKTYQLFKSSPYAKNFTFVDPIQSIELADAELFDCSRVASRDPQETKGKGYKETMDTGDVCGGDSCC
jgi:SAM-dependent methyltransferase